MSADLIATVRARARRLIVVPSTDLPASAVYAIRRFRSEETPDLREALGPELLDRAGAPGSTPGTVIAEALDADLVLRARVLRACEARICGAVEAVGVALDDVPPGVQPVGTPIEAVCIELGPGLWTRPVTFIAGPTAGPTAGPDDELSVHDLSPGERALLGFLIFTALED